MHRACVAHTRANKPQIHACMHPTRAHLPANSLAYTRACATHTHTHAHMDAYLHTRIDASHYVAQSHAVSDGITLHTCMHRTHAHTHTHKHATQEHIPAHMHRVHHTHAHIYTQMNTLIAYIHTCGPHMHCKHTCIHARMQCTQMRNKNIQPQRYNCMPR